MQVICVQAHGYHKPGDVAEVPDGAEVCPVYWEPVKAKAAPPAAAAVKPADTATAGA